LIAADRGIADGNRATDGKNRAASISAINGRKRGVESAAEAVTNGISCERAVFNEDVTSVAEDGAAELGAEEIWLQAGVAVLVGP
jgi:hypothetical protein